MPPKTSIMSDYFSLSPVVDESAMPKVFVRLTTNYFKTKRGLSFLRKIDFLKRKCVGYNFVDEDANMIGVDETLARITNLHNAKDGVYEIITCNERHDWETGTLDDWDFLLVPIGDENPKTKKT